MTIDKTGKEKSFSFVYSNPMLRYAQNWGHIVTERLLGQAGQILDLGAGTGEHQKLATPGNTYTALDLDGDVLKIGRSQGRNTIAVQGTAGQLPFSDGCFDGIVSIYTLEHFSGLDGCIDEMARVLKPGGILAAAIPTEGTLFRLGRRLVTAPFAVRRLGFESIKAYEAYVASQHINTPEAIFDSLARHFELVEKRWFPFFLPGKALNIMAAFKAVKPYLQGSRVIGRK